MDEVIGAVDSKNLITKLQLFLEHFFIYVANKKIIVIGLSGKFKKIQIFFCIILDMFLFLGGGMIDSLSQILPKIDTNWKNVKFIFCDERLVPIESSESTFGEYLRKLVPNSNGSITHNNFIVPNLEIEGERCAKSYEESIFPLGNSIDLLLLGMGPDGHTCSLFPNHKLLESSKLVDFIRDSPKPPPRRITLTLKCIAAAQNVVFIATGASKKPVLKDILSRGPESLKYPAGLVKSKNCKLTWFVDTDVCNEID